MLNFFLLKLFMCICIQSALITFRKIYQSKILFLSHLQILITYFLNSSSMNLRVNDLITNEKKEEKNKKMNDSLFV